MNKKFIQYIINSTSSDNENLKYLYSALLKETDSLNQFRKLEADKIKTAYNDGNIEDIKLITENLPIVQSEIQELNEVLYLLENFLFKDFVIILDINENSMCPICNKQMPVNSTHFVLFNNSLKEKITGRDYTKTSYCNDCKRRYITNIAYQKILSAYDINLTNLKINKNYCLPPIDIYSVIVLSNTLNCSTTGHKTKDIRAKLPSISENGELAYCEINASYCYNCDRFTVLKEDFNNVKMKNTIICKVIDETTEYKTARRDEVDIAQRKSVLFNYGYNVQTKINLTDKQRQIILSSVIEANIMNRRDIINHINGLIERGSKIPSWRLATQKWKQDKQFVTEYKTGDLPEILVNNIILKYNKG